MTHSPAFDKAKAKAFTQKVLADTSGMAATLMAFIGDQLGLFKSLAEQGPATSAELAARAHTHERYVREWLHGMTSASYLTYDATTDKFALPPEHRAPLAQPHAPVFFGGIHEMLMGLVGPLDQVVQAFRDGGGVPQSAYNHHMWDGLERDSTAVIENYLLQWVSLIPDLHDKLERGALVADVGCGSGRALIKLAQHYPHSHYVGYDVFAPTIERATANAQQAGMAERVRFHLLDAAEGLPESYDIIATFDVIHDAVDPLKLLRAICQALQPDGIYLCMDANCSDKIEENIGPLPTLRYGFSILYCLTSSLAHGGAGLGTLGLTKSKLRELCAEAGFSTVRKVTPPDAIHAVYEVKP